FIVGCGRSGTTVLRQFLSCSDDVFEIPFETAYFSDYYHRYGDISNSKNLRRLSVDLTLRFNYKRSKVDMNVFLKSLSNLSKLTYEDYFELFANYSAKMNNKNNPPVIIEKTPRHAYYVKEIIDAFPKTKIIGIIRDPLATISSLMQTRAKRLNFLPISRRAKLLASVWDWTRYYQALRNLERDLTPSHLTIVKYEDLILNTDKVVNTLNEFLGICIERNRFPKKLRKDSLYKYSSYLSQKQISLIISALPKEVFLNYKYENLGKIEKHNEKIREIVYFLCRLEVWIETILRPGHKRILKKISNWGTRA
ncbi:MAG: sulfotransferase, partial [Candidatus Hodarchaeota archaeon]